MVEKSLDGAIGIAIKGSLGDDAVLAKIVPLLCQGQPVKQSSLHIYPSAGQWRLKRKIMLLDFRV